MNSPSVDLSALCPPYIMSEQQSEMLPTVYRLNETNEPLSTDEETLLRQWQYSFLSPLSEVDAAMDRVRLQLEQRSEQRAAMQRLHDLPKPALSVMRGFPTETLQEIFSYFAPLDTYNSLFEEDRNAEPFRIGHVSRKWRSVAHSYPALWKRTLYLKVDNAVTLRDPLALLNFVLTRLGQDVSFELEGPKEHSELTSRIIEALVEVFPRWQSVVFSNLPLDVLPLLSSMSSPAPRLRELTLGVCSTVPADIHISGFSHCFSLEKLELDCIPFGSISLPYGALRECVDRNSYRSSESPSRALEIVRSCTNLRSLTTTPPHWYIMDIWNTFPRVTHSSLTSLETSDAGLLAILLLPSLSELAFVNFGFDRFAPPLDNLAQIQRFIQKSACDLTSLTLEDCVIYGGDVAIEELLLSTPNLRHLSLDFSVETSDGSCMTELVKHMSRRDSVLVPQLQSLKYSEACNSWQLGFVEEGFVDMLESRYSADGLGLKSVTIKFDAPRPEKVLKLGGKDRERLLKMKHAGLFISILAWNGHRLI